MELFISTRCGYVPTDTLPREDSDRHLLLYCLCKFFDSVAQPTKDGLLLTLVVLAVVDRFADAEISVK